MNIWNGEAYDAIVLAGNWEQPATNKSENRRIEAADVYKSIDASFQMPDNESVASYLADNDQCETARHLLEQMILWVGKAFSDNTPLQDDRTCQNKAETEKMNQWNNLIRTKMIPVPMSNDWNDCTTKVRKISFAKSNTRNNPAPDPVLLLAKATSNWLRRHNIEILPTYCSGRGSGYDNDDSSRLRDETTYSIDSMSDDTELFLKDCCHMVLYQQSPKTHASRIISDDEYDY